MTAKEMIDKAEIELGIPVDTITVSFTPQHPPEFQNRFYLHFGDICAVGSTLDEAILDARKELKVEHA